jgi:hypothetical protein
VEIAAEIGVSRSSVSLWARDLPRVGRVSFEETRKRNAEGVSSYWQAEGPRREARRQAVSAEAAVGIGTLSDRELLIAGAIAYWCEGTKNKLYRRSDRVVFVNSDPGLIRFFLRFLVAVGTSPDRIVCCVHIHENADAAQAQDYWQDVTGLEPRQFRRPSIKRHNPKTVRKNTGANYYGCLVLYVRSSSELYRQIEGWASGAMTGAAALAAGEPDSWQHRGSPDIG